MRKVVVIDAGHGGKDPGTSGASTVEKDLTLAAARDLRAMLQRTGRYQVVLTRDNDTFVPLDQRMQIARREHADLFISLHVNSINDPTLHGASVYTLSEKGEDRVARQVFTRNGDWLTTADGGSRDPSVNRILLDLTQRQTTNQSTGFANILLDRMNGRVDLVRRSHRDANFAVLLAPDVPAVLLEMGFITNPVDEQRLASAEQRREMADAITDAIDGYFARPARLAVR
jgi:N-acetylmuramoyl-L-alanine amidase